MIKMLASEIANVINGKLISESDFEVSGDFQFDSRVIKSGEVFLALSGEKLDGHDFAEDAFARGAILAIVSKTITGPHILVSDVLTSVSILAREVRKKLIDLKVVGITGSQGKTTTKDMLHTVLTSSGKTIAPFGSYNNDIGVPITLLRCSFETKFCILEMGARHMGDIGKLTQIGLPDVGIVLKVGVAHLGEFGSRENIAKTKGELIRGLREGATAVLGDFDEFTPKMADGLNLKKYLFGISNKDDFRAADIEIKGGFAAFDLVTPESREHVELQVLGEHQIPNALAAAAAAFALGLSTSQIASALSSHKSSSKWRMDLRRIAQITVIDDSYNANPESMRAALKTLSLLAQESGGNSWAFLGKMHELGPEEAAMHQDIATVTEQLGVDHLVAIGERNYLVSSNSEKITRHFAPDLQSAQKFFKEINSGDAVLIKASRAENLNELAEELYIELKSRESEE
jgi:UDP-N-acetylmuramoyl-tripeptide--D-alanyl-D-alanine ligase